MPVLELTPTETSTAAPAVQDAQWPVEAKGAAKALETAFPPILDRRGTSRGSFKQAAPFAPDDVHPEAPPLMLYTRDVNPWEMGFITNDKLRIGHRGVVMVISRAGEEIHAECTVRRCREFKPGWFEGVVHFRNEQPAFAEQ